MEIVIPPFAQYLYDNESGHPIVKYPHPILRQKAAPVTKITQETQKLIDRMIRAMRDANGIGLAAPQVGVGQRIVIIAPAEESAKAVINPVLEQFSEEKELGQEGCLSIPSLYGDVERSLRVVLTGLNRKGKPVKYELVGMPARIAQHELDHLDGVLFIDKVDVSTLHWSLPEQEDEDEEPVGARR